MKVEVSPDVPVVAFAAALASGGLQLESTTDGGLRITWTPTYREDGVTPSGFVPAFLRWPVATAPTDGANP